MKPYFETELGQLYNGDCLEVMQHLIKEDIKIDIIITDPPYGIEMSKGVSSKLGTSGGKEYDDDWDSESPKKVVFETMQKLSDKMIVFGGNYFTDKLPQSNKWLVWDKACDLPNNTGLSDCELVYTTINGNNVKKYEFRQMGFIAHERERFHPTQKPVGLLRAIVDDFTEEAETVMDGYSGSGTTAVACEQLGRKWICIEKEKKYCDITIQRLSEIQQTLF